MIPNTFLRDITGPVTGQYGPVTGPGRFVPRSSHSIILKKVSGIMLQK